MGCGASNQQLAAVAEPRRKLLLNFIILFARTLLMVITIEPMGNKKL